MEIAWTDLYELQQRAGVRPRLLLSSHTKEGYLLRSCNAAAAALFDLEERSMQEAPLPAHAFSSALVTYLERQGPRLNNDPEQHLPLVQIHDSSSEKYYAKVYCHLMPSSGFSNSSPEKLYLFCFEKEAEAISNLEAGKLEAMGELTCGVAHDFNNLIMGIQAHAEQLLTSPSLSSEEQHFVVNILRACSSGISLTGSLLRYAKRQPLSRGLLDVVYLVHDVLNMAKLSSRKEHHFSLSKELEVEASPIEVVGCYASLSHCLMNLVKNAREATPNGGGIEIMWRGDSETAELVIRDTGKGISEKDLPHVFEPFYSTKSQGTGLGLAMAQSILSQHEGEVSITSQIGKGTEISLRWPRFSGVKLADSPRPYPTEQLCTHFPKLLHKSSKLAFIIEDNLVVRGGIRGLIEQLGYTAVAYSHAEEALEDLAFQPIPDLVLVDFSMPGMSGIDFIDHWMKKLPASYQQAKTQLFLMSGFSPDYFQTLLDESICKQVCFLQKPFNLEVLSEALKDPVKFSSAAS